MIRPRGCTNLAAANLRGTGYVARYFVWEELSGTIRDGLRLIVRARFAGLAEGYLLSKCVACPDARGREGLLRPRSTCSLHNRAGGPEQAARRLLDGGLADELGALGRPFSR